MDASSVQLVAVQLGRGVGLGHRVLLAAWAVALGSLDVRFGPN